MTQFSKLQLILGETGVLDQRGERGSEQPARAERVFRVHFLQVEVVEEVVCERLDLEEAAERGVDVAGVAEVLEAVDAGLGCDFGVAGLACEQVRVGAHAVGNVQVAFLVSRRYLQEEVARVLHAHLARLVVHAELLLLLVE